MIREISILIIEDDARDAEVLMSRWVQRVPDCSVTVARNFAEACSIFKSQRDFACICLDLRLLPDDLDGLKTLQLLRARAPGVLIVVISGTITPEQVTLFSNLGGIYICKKGMTWTDLDPLFHLLRL